ncbi:MAG: hypothetical protein LBH98_05990 [Chitinispirillales bacterium]|jgi:hypothetical protein|nr:hypothetical protein [Chitinispirillales bacterium]
MPMGATFNNGFANSGPTMMGSQQAAAQKIKANTPQTLPTQANNKNPGLFQNDNKNPKQDIKSPVADTIQNAKPNLKKTQAQQTAAFNTSASSQQEALNRNMANFGASMSANAKDKYASQDYVNQTMGAQQNQLRDQQLQAYQEMLMQQGQQELDLDKWLNDAKNDEWNYVRQMFTDAVESGNWGAVQGLLENYGHILGGMDGGKLYLNSLLEEMGSDYQIITDKIQEAESSFDPNLRNEEYLNGLYSEQDRLEGLIYDLSNKISTGEYGENPYTWEYDRLEKMSPDEFWNDPKGKALTKAAISNYDDFISSGNPYGNALVNGILSTVKMNNADGRPTDKNVDRADIGHLIALEANGIIPAGTCAEIGQLAGYLNNLDAAGVYQKVTAADGSVQESTGTDKESILSDATFQELARKYGLGDIIDKYEEDVMAKQEKEQERIEQEKIEQEKMKPENLANKDIVLTNDDKEVSITYGAFDYAYQAFKDFNPSMWSGNKRKDQAARNSIVNAGEDFARILNNNDWILDLLGWDKPAKEGQFTTGGMSDNKENRDTGISNLKKKIKEVNELLSKFTYTTGFYYENM